MTDEGFPVRPFRLSWEGAKVYSTPWPVDSPWYREPEVIAESESPALDFLVQRARQQVFAAMDEAAMYGTPNTLAIPATAWENLRRYAENRMVYDWPRRGFPEDQVATVLAFVARGDFDLADLIGCICSTFTERARLSAEAAYDGWWGALASEIAVRTIRRAKREKRIAWSPHDQCHVALPAWRHKPIHDRRGWCWPKP